MFQLYLNLTTFNNCRSKLGLSALSGYLLASTYYGLTSGLSTFWAFNFNNGSTDQRYARWGYPLLPIADYE